MITIDVFVKGPIPLDSPFSKFDNVIATPHMAASTTEAMSVMSLEYAKEIERVKNNE